MIVSPVISNAEELPAESPPEAATVLPEPGAIQNNDPWADWNIAPPLLPAPDPSAGFELPPAAELLPAKAFPAATRRFRKIIFEGNRSFSSDTLAALVSWALDRPLDPVELDNVRETITRHYIQAGYINSGATLPDQDLNSGELRIQVTEGKLTGVTLRGNRNLRDTYLKTRVLGNPSDTMDFPSLQKRLQILQGNENIGRIQAELRPGNLPGESFVDLVIEETPRWSYGMDLNNYLPPSVGSEQVELWLENRNLTGFSDTLALNYGVFSGGVDETGWSGLDNVMFQYLLPVSRYDTTLAWTMNQQGYAIIEEPFAELGITGETRSVSLGLRQPLIRTFQDELWTSLTLTRQHSETSLLGEPFSVSPGYVNGELDLAIASWGLEWTRRQERQFIVAGSLLSVGLNALDATESDQPADSSFVRWNLNGQYLRRMNEAGHLLSLGVSSNSQTIHYPLRNRPRWAESIPSAAIGRMNWCGTWLPASVSNTGFQSLKMDLGTSIFIPFCDGGIAWNHQDGNQDELLAVGCGVTANYRDWFRCELYYGYPLIKRPDNNDNLQDQGIYFQLSVGKF